MDMQQMPQQGEEQGEQDYLAMMKQAYELLGKAIEAAGGEEQNEGMAVNKAFNQGFGDTGGY